MQTTSLGRVLEGRYRLDAPLGSGASAEVYRAFDLELARSVAVKLVHRGLASDASFLSRFQAEAQAVAALNHPNIVQIHDWGKDEGQPFLVLEYLAGGSLRNLLESGERLGLPEVVQIGTQAARALEFAHGRGFVHRDIKPANLLFDSDGNIHVADFGLAAMVAAAWTEPMGMVFGTARYASPEQARGENVTEKSDLYSLAIVCYEALTGETPFVADTPLATLMARTYAPLPRSPKLGPLAPILDGATRLESSTRMEVSTFASQLEALSLELPAALLPLRSASPNNNEPLSSMHLERLQNADDPTTFALNRPGDTAAIAIDVVGDDQEPTAKDAENAEARTPLRRRRSASHSKRRIVFGIAAGLLAIAVASGAVAYVHYDVYGYSVPKLEAMSLSSARHAVHVSGLRLTRVSHKYSSSVPAGEVVAESIQPGTHVRENTSIDLAVSLGHAPVEIPHLVGTTSALATATVRKIGFRMIVHNLYNETAPLGTVISAAPASGKAPYGSSIDVTVSLGPQPRTIPDLSGLAFAQAKQQLVSLRLVALKSVAYSNDVPVGHVISSAPAFGATGIPVGSKVRLIVSRGLLLVVVPDVIGDPIATAVAAMRAVGLNVVEVIGPPFATTATTSDPAPGSAVVSGSDVTLYAS